MPGETRNMGVKGVRDDTWMTKVRQGGQRVKREKGDTSVRNTRRKMALRE